MKRALKGLELLCVIYIVPFHSQFVVMGVADVKNLLPLAIDVAGAL